jgi:hypothetical protein
MSSPSRPANVKKEFAQKFPLGRRLLFQETFAINKGDSAKMVNEPSITFALARRFRRC